MPPRKQTTSQKSLSSMVAVASSYERKPLPLPILPDSSSVTPLWTPSSKPKEVFPEWPNAAVLASENWGNEDEPYEDPTVIPTELFAASQNVTWKRPSQFLPVIPEPMVRTAASTLAPVVPDPKHAAGKKPAPAAAKKAESEPPKKPKAPRFAHIVYVPPSENHHPPPQTHPPAHAPSAIDPKKHLGGAAAVSHPSTPAPAVVSPPQPLPRRIDRDFRRLWSDEQQEELRLWNEEEARIEKQKERRESDYMVFEDATAFIVNDRPRQPLQEEPVDAEDLEDDGEDDGDEDGQGLPVPDSSPYGGILPPLRMEIAPNAIVKPEIPHGKVVHADFASYLRVVDQLHQRWVRETTTGVPYLWEAIYPQDAQGVPTYNPAGKYSVKLFVGGKWRRVDVDDKMPVDSENHILVVSSSMKNEIWPAILAKALLKVISWLGFPSGPPDDTRNDVVRLTSVVVTALTSWKVTLHASAAMSGGDFQSLQEYVPESHASDAQDELVLDGGDEEPPDSPEVLDAVTPSDKLIETPKPRAIACSTALEGLGDLSFREASLVVDIVIDSGNLTIKGINLNGATSFAEDILTANAATFLIVHPPFRFSDLIAETWPVDSNGLAVPYSNPVAQFCVINKMKRHIVHEGEEGSISRTPRSDFVDVAFTLTRIPPETPSAQEIDGATELAKHLNVDPDGSVILVEDMELDAYRHRLSGAGLPVRRPLVCKVTTTSSACLRLPRGEFESIAFRVYPQRACRYGYSIQVEADVKVDWQVANLHWRNVWDLQVIEADGSFPVMLPNSWNVMFKQSIELAPPAEEGSPSPELHIDLHLSDPDLSSSVHTYLVSSHADKMFALSGLHARAVLPGDSLVYTLIVECCPKAAIPEGKWRLTLGSNRFFKHATIQQPRLTVFDGVYEPNKPMVCLRDVVTHPKKTSMTSVQFEFVKAESTKNDDLTAKLEIIDLISGKLLSEVTGRGITRVLQLPPPVKTDDDPNDEKSGYIIQASIDTSKCHVPEWARSVRPFSYKNSIADPPKEKAIEEDEENARPPTAKTSRVHLLKWRLTCWSVDEVKLEFDRAQELRFDAIRATWAEAAKDRDAHGASSRLMFLGKADAAQAAMADDGVSDELMVKYKARLDWLHQAPEKVEGEAPSRHIQVQFLQEPQNETLKSVEDFARDEQQLQAELDETQAMMQAIREERAAAKEARAAQLKDMVQSFRDQRKEADFIRQALYAQRDQVRAQLQINIPAGATA